MSRGLVERFKRLPHTARLPLLRRPSETEIATRVVGNLISLPEYADRVDEVSRVLTSIDGGKDREPNLGSARDISIAMKVISERTLQGLLSPGIAKGYLTTLGEKRALASQQSSPEQALALRIDAILHMPVSRRRFLWGTTVLSAALLASTMALGTQPTSERVIDPDILLDSQPKEKLTEVPSDISKGGWRVRLAPGDKKFGQESNAIMLDNGFGFYFGGEVFGGNGINIRAYKNEQGTIIPFLRVYPQEGKPKDYILQTQRDQNQDLVTDVVIFERLNGELYNTKFKVLVSGDTFKFAGYYVYPTSS